MLTLAPFVCEGRRGGPRPIEAPASQKRMKVSRERRVSESFPSLKGKDRCGFRYGQMVGEKGGTTKPRKKKKPGGGGPR